MNVARLTIVACALAAACAEAGGDPHGGEITDAGMQAIEPGAFMPPDSGTLSVCEGSGSKWSDLYRDIFGPTGRPGSCSFASNCHGTPTGMGAMSGGGIHCFDEATCRQSMIDNFLATPDNKDAPRNANLFGILRHPAKNAAGFGGIMPKEPGDFIFPEPCLQRIAGWIANGVPAD